MKSFASFVAGFALALMLAANASVITLTSSAGDDTRLVAAFTALLQPGCPAACRSATAADIKAWVISQLYVVVKNYEYQQSVNAIAQPSAITTN